MCNVTRETLHILCNGTDCNDAMKEKVLCLSSGCVTDCLCPFYKPTYDILVGRIDKKE